MAEVEVEKTPSIGISFNVPFVNQRTLVLQSFIDRECSADDLNKLLDKLRGAADRQNAIVQLELTQKALENAEKEAERHAWRMARVEENIQREWNNGGRKGDLRLSPKEKEDQRIAIANAEQIKSDIERIHKEAEHWRSIAGA
jgi:hypothetical protein